MPFTLNGIGTTYYGKRDHAADGSYVTTEWFVFVFLPIAPLGSYRVRPTGQSANLILYYSTRYSVERVPLCMPQVRNGYLVTGSLVGPLMVPMVWSAIAAIPTFIIILLTVVLLYAIAFFLFLKARKAGSRGAEKQGGEGERQRQVTEPYRQPANDSVHPLYLKILQLLNGDRTTAERLLALVRRQHPDRSNQWCHEKVLDDLIRDRQ